MTERQLADVLRHIDDEVAPDAAEIEFKVRLRADLDETLDRDAVKRARLVASDPYPRRRPAAVLAVAAAIVTVVVGVLIVAERPTSDAPASPIAPWLSISTTTVPVLDALAACERFRASNADELLEAVIPRDLTVAQVDEALNAVEVLLADIDATHPDDPFRPVLVRVRNATREAALRLEANDPAGARPALEAARVEIGTPLESTEFAHCIDR